MTKALNYIQRGKTVWQHLQKGSIYDAVNFNMKLNTNHTTQDIQTLKNAFNSNDATFWNLVKDDIYFKEKAKKHNIPFTLETIQSKEFSSYFRAKYARRYIKNKQTLKTFNRAYLETIVQTQWYLYAHAIIQEDRPISNSNQKLSAFTSGMITIQDPNHALFKFLDSYAELNSPHYKNHDAISLYSLAQTKAYPRKSSHYGGQKQSFGSNSQDFGIDIQDHGHQPLKDLPGNKSHLLFGIRDNGMIFVKWENYGVTINPVKGDYSAFPHTMAYFEKDGKEDDTRYHMREAIPKAIITEFEKLYTKPLSEATKQNINTYGISAMLKHLEQESPQNALIFKHYLMTEKGYQPNTLHLRKGGEVILHSSNIL